MSNSRQKLKPWLVAQIEGGRIPGLFWLNDERTKFQMPWAHKGRHDWTPESCLLFKEWEINNGRFQEGINEPSYPEWKTRMRCALHKSSDFELIKEESVTESFRIYQLRERDNRQVLAGRNLNQNPASPHNRDTPSAAPSPAALPACVEDAFVSEEGSLPSDFKNLSTSEMQRLHDPNESAMAISFDLDIDVDMLSNHMSSLGLGRGPKGPPAVPTDIKPTLRQVVGPPADSPWPTESQQPVAQMRSPAPPSQILPYYASDLDTLDAFLGAIPPSDPPQLAEGQFTNSTAQVGGLYTNSTRQSTVIDQNQAEQNGSIYPNPDDQRHNMFLNPAGEVNITYTNPADQSQGIYQIQPGQKPDQEPGHPTRLLQQVPDSCSVAHQRIAYENPREIPEQAYTNGVYLPATEQTAAELFGVVSEDDPLVNKFLDELLGGADISTLVQHWGSNDGVGAEFENLSL